MNPCPVSDYYDVNAFRGKIFFYNFALYHIVFFKTNYLLTFFFIHCVPQDI